MNEYLLYTLIGLLFIYIYYLLNEIDKLNKRINKRLGVKKK